MVDFEREARKFQDALDATADQIAALTAIISLMPEARKVDRHTAKQVAGNLSPSSGALRHAEKLLDRLLPMSPQKDGLDQG